MSEHTAWCLIGAAAATLYLAALVVAGMMTVK